MRLVAVHEVLPVLAVSTVGLCPGTVLEADNALPAFYATVMGSVFVWRQSTELLPNPSQQLQI